MLSYSVFISEPFVFQLHHLGLTEWIICVHLFLSLSSSVTPTFCTSTFATSINLLCLIHWAVSSDPLLDILLEANFAHLWQWDWKHMNSKSKRCGSILFFFHIIYYESKNHHSVDCMLKQQFIWVLIYFLANTYRKIFKQLNVLWYLLYIRTKRQYIQ